MSFFLQIYQNLEKKIINVKRYENPSFRTKIINSGLKNCQFIGKDRSCTNRAYLAETGDQQPRIRWPSNLDSWEIRRLDDKVVDGATFFFHYQLANVKIAFHRNAASMVSYLKQYDKI